MVKLFCVGKEKQLQVNPFSPKNPQKTFYPKYWAYAQKYYILHYA